jgi:hypothetical protein
MDFVFIYCRQTHIATQLWQRQLYGFTGLELYIWIYTPPETARQSRNVTRSNILSLGLLHHTTI